MEQLNVDKAELVRRLQAIKRMGWVHTGRSRNDGSVGNTLEDLLGIRENNFSIANTVDWELKTQRAKTSSLITLFHMEPKPRNPSVVAGYLLPRFGWAHDEAGRKYPAGEKSFRATVAGNAFTGRGLKVSVNSVARRIEILYDPARVSARYAAWREELKAIGEGAAQRLAYWDFDEVAKKCVGKIRNAVFVVADSRKAGGQEEFRYRKITLLEDFAFNNLLRAIINGYIFVDFDARTGHNHGTKFRIAQNSWPVLYNRVTEIE
jgi:hypothetical protein